MIYRSTWRIKSSIPPARIAQASQAVAANLVVAGTVQVPHNTQDSVWRFRLLENQVSGILAFGKISESASKYCEFTVIS